MRASRDRACASGYSPRVELLRVVEGLGARMQLPLCVAQPTAEGELRLLFANDACNVLLCWPDDAWPRTSLAKFLPTATVDAVKAWLEEPSSWRNMDATRADGVVVPVAVSVAEVEDADERAIVVFLRDRSESVRHQQELEAAAREATAQRDAAEQARADADTARQLAEAAKATAEAEKGRAEELQRVAEEARQAAERDAFVQRKLSVQTELFRTLFHGVIGLVVMVAALTVFSWITNKNEKDSLAMFERILLVLTGMLGTAVASIFDARRGEEPKK